LKILLISSNTLTVPYPVYPLGLDYVAGAISEPHQVEILDLAMQADDRELSRVIDRFGPDLVGLGIRNIDSTDVTDPVGFIDQARDVVGEIRRHTRSPVVLGGSGFTLFPGQLMAELGADFGIAGEGERLGELIESLASGREPAGIPGLYQASGPSTPTRPWEGKVSRPDPKDSGHIGRYLDRGGMLNLQSKRGCPHQCIYCTYPRIEGRRLRLFDPERVGRQARSLQERGARYLFLTDSSFNADTEHNLAVARAMIDCGVSIPWGAFFSPLRPPDGYYRQLKEAGLQHVEFGTDSLCDRMLASYGKPFRCPDVLAAHRAAREAGLHVAHYLMPGGPGEDASTLAETLERAESLSGTVLFFFCGVRVYPHTRLFDIAVDERQILADQDLLSPFFYHSKNLPEGEVEAAVRRAAHGRVHWVIGSGGERYRKLTERMHARGKTGPLWEGLVAE
jgi:radical SAM superfamily enzyme YgiQ (UPF0313 family)